jgi:hypothetical protein
MQEDLFREFEINLDKNGENKVFVKFKLLENGGLEEFVVIYFTLVDGVFLEVLKYDFSKNEKLHLHCAYDKKRTKVFLDEEPSLDTLVILKDVILVSWKKHLLKFKER